MSSIAERQPSNSERFRLFRRTFMPSLSLSRYIIRLFFSRFFLLLFLLVTVLQMLDMLNQAEKIVANEGADRGALLFYIQLRLPELISQFVPFAVLLACLFSLASLSQSSEVTIMRAAGLSAPQIMTPMLACTILICVCHGLFHDWVTVDSSRRLFHWRDTKFQLPVLPLPQGRSNILINDGDRVIKVGEASRTKRIVILDNVTIYERAENGDLVNHIEADYAQKSEGKWTLVGVRRFDLNKFQLSTSVQEEWAFDIPLQPIFAQLDRPDHARIGELLESIKTLEQSGMETFSLKSSLFHRVAIALSSLIMPLLASFVAFGSPRGGARFGRVIIGMAAGFSFFVMDNYMSAMGTMGIMPPLFAAFVSLAIYLLGGLSILVRTE